MINILKLISISLPKTIRKFPFYFILLGFILINILFLQWNYWHELIVDKSKLGAAYGEVQVSELLMDKIYHNLISGNNPFKPITGVLYPFSLDIVGSDPGFAFNFVLFRPFLSIHQALSITIIMNLFLANLAMYLLLRKLNFDRIVSFLIGLAYGFMTYLTVRLSQPDYSVIYVFPCFFYCFFSFLKATKLKIKIISAFGLSLFTSLTLWLNSYYFLVLLISCFFLIVYLFFMKRNVFLIFIKKNIHFLFLYIILVILINIPWFIALRETFLFSDIPKSPGWGGANLYYYSSDLFNFFIPSGYNYYYGQITQTLFQSIDFARNIYENFTYPGIIILLSYFFLIIFWKKYPKALLKKIKPYYYVSLFFIVLSLGPFLHIAGGWFIELEEGIRLIFPLPFIILHYLPIVGNIRAPGRLIIGFIFFAYIVCAYILTYFLQQKSVKFKIVFVLIFIFIFIIDHRMAEDKTLVIKQWPNKIYNYIKNDPLKVSVLEIPFTVRDGFTYFGDMDTIYAVYGESLHQKSVLGLYAGRIPNYIKDYYQKNALIGYLGRLIDINWQNNPGLIGQKIQEWDKLNHSKANETIKFLDLKYIIQDDKKEYSATVSAILGELGYKKILSDQNYLLWEKKPQGKEFISIEMNQNDPNLSLGFGWYGLEDNFRWADRRASIMFRVNQPKKYKLNFKAIAFYKDQLMTIYLNKKKVAKVSVSTETKEYSIPINIPFEPGINTLYFIFDRYFRPSDVIPGNLDQRWLSSGFNKIWLTKL